MCAEGLQSEAHNPKPTGFSRSLFSFNIFSALAQFERRLIQERTKAGLAAARARGKLGGRKKIPASEPRVVLAKKLFADKSISINDICETMKISRATLYRYVRMKEE